MFESISEDKLSVVLYNERTKVLWITYNGIVDPVVASANFEKVLGFSSSHEVKGILADLRALRGSFMRFMEFFESEAYPILIKNGLTSEAIVTTDDDLIIQNMSEKLQDLLLKMGLNCEVFMDLDDAEQWLNNILRRN